MDPRVIAAIAISVSHRSTPAIASGRARTSPSATQRIAMIAGANTSAKIRVMTKKRTPANT